MSLARLMPFAATAFLLGAGTALASEPGTFDRTLAVSGPVVLDVRSDRGGVIVTVGSATSLRVHAVIKPLYGKFDLDIAEANIRALEKDPPIEQVGNQIRIGYVKDPALLRGVTIRFEIEAPRATEVRARTESGGIRIDGVNGPASTETQSGRTDISDVTGQIKVVGHSGAVIIRNAGNLVSVRNQSGGIQLTRIGGEVEAETTSGRTEIRDVFGNIRSTTESGSIIIDTAKAAVYALNRSGSIDATQLGGAITAETRSGAIRISQVSPAPIRAFTKSGAIRVDLAGQSGYEIDARSDSGKVSGPLAKNGDARKLLTKLGAGGPLVDLDTHSARIDIVR